MSDRFPSGDISGEFDWEGSEDLTSVPEQELSGKLVELAEEERAVSYRRRILQGRIDVIRSELVRRGGTALSPEDLARVLMGETPAERESEES